MRNLATAISVFLICTMLTLVSALALVRSSKVQTALVSVFTEQLSRALGTEVTVQGVDIRMPGNIRLDSLFLGDQTGDTLLVVPSLFIRFNPFAIQEERLDFRQIQLRDAFVNVKQFDEGTNFDFLLRAFASKEESPQPFPFVINIDDINFANARIRYQNIPSEMDVLVTNIHAQMHLPILSEDSVIARLESLSLKAEVPAYEIVAEGSFFGDLDTLFASNLALYYKQQCVMLGDIRLANPLCPDSFYIHASCKELTIRPHELADILSVGAKRPVTLPQQIYALGRMRYRGELSGRWTDLNLHGAFLSRIGTITTKMHVSTDKSLSSVAFNGQISTPKCAISPDMTGYNIRCTLDGQYDMAAPLSCTGQVTIGRLRVKDYTYHNLSLNLSNVDSLLQVTMNVHDPNVDASLEGVVNYAQDLLVEADLQLNHFRPEELQLLTKDVDKADISCAAHLTLLRVSSAEYPSSNILDNLLFNLTINDLRITNYGKLLEVRRILLASEKTANGRQLKLQSDFINGAITGDFDWSSLPATLRVFLHNSLPDFVSLPQGKRGQKHKPTHLDYYLYCLNADTILPVLGYAHLSAPKKQTLKGYLYEDENTYSLQAFVPSIDSDNSAWQNITLSIANVGDEGRISLSTIKHTIDRDSTKLIVGDIGVLFTTMARNDSLLTAFRFGDMTRDYDAANMHIVTHLARYNTQPLISVHMLPSTFYVGDTVWVAEDALVEYNAADTMLAVRGLHMYSNSQSISVHGITSANEQDSLTLSLSNVDIGYLVRFIELEKVLDIRGLVSGWVTLYSLFTTPMVEANLRVPDAYINKSYIGDVTASAHLDKPNKQILISAEGNHNGHQLVRACGRAIPERHDWELDLHVDSVDLCLLNKWTTGILDDVSGRGYGDVHIFGHRVSTYVTTRTYADSASFTLPFTGARYTFSDSILLDTTSIQLNHITLHDGYGHQGLLNGTITHQMFSHFALNLGADCDHLLAMDLPYDPQSLYYGRVFASGHVAVYGTEDALHVDVNATTEANSDFYLSTVTAASARDNSFITFKESNAHQFSNSSHPQSTASPNGDVPEGTVSLTLSMSVTPLATIHLLMDPHNGNGIIGRGEGDIRLSITDDMSTMIGTYTLSSGSFSFTLANLISRNFDIAPGSSIIWSGDPVNPLLDVTAKYHVTASLKDLFGSDEANIATNRSSVPVNCIIYLRDKLNNPELRFGIELPQSDESVNSQVMSIINTEEMLMRQVVYLLVFNRFFTPEYLRKDASSTGLNETYSLLSSTVTGQINAWLGKLTDIFSMGIAIRADLDDAQSSDEYEAQFRLQPVKRLTINGNFGYRTNDLTNRPFFGDLDLEYELTPDGKLRAKAYTHTVDKYSLKQANTVQGIGFLFRHDFNWPSRKKKPDK